MYRIAALDRGWQSLLDHKHPVTRCDKYLASGDYLGSVEGFHRGSYRYLLMSYLFSGAYPEPMDGIAAGDLYNTPHIWCYPPYRGETELGRKSKQY